MANAARRRTNNGIDTDYRERAYVDGNTVRRVQEAPVVQQPELPQVSTKIKQNRAKATSMSSAFVMFLLGVCVAILFTGVNYLQMKSELVKQTKAITSLQSEYSQLKADNDAYYSQVSSSADMDNIKAIAIKRLGMKYATKEQVITYETERSSYVKQYQDIPDVE